MSSLWVASNSAEDVRDLWGPKDWDHTECVWRFLNKIKTTPQKKDYRKEGFSAVDNGTQLVKLPFSGLLCCVILCHISCCFLPSLSPSTSSLSSVVCHPFLTLHPRFFLPPTSSTCLCLSSPFSVHHHLRYSSLFVLMLHFICSPSTLVSRAIEIEYSCEISLNW